jgi:hypothetical protein
VDWNSDPPRLSSAVFAPASLDGATSAEVESLIHADAMTLIQRVEAVADATWGAIRLSVLRVNELECKVVYAPIAPGEPFGPNPYHANIHGTRSKGKRKALLKNGMWTWIREPDGF